MNANETTKWVMDPSHSEIGFRVKHLMISNVSGIFREFEGEAVTKGEGFSDAAITVTLNSASIDTDAADRDAHLKSPDFFDAANYPKLKFEGKGLKNLGNNQFELTGNLTIREVTRPVKLSVEYGGQMKDPWGNVKVGFTVTGKINRKEWGLNWNAALETGGVLVSDEVRLNAEVQFVKQN